MQTVRTSNRAMCATAMCATAVSAVVDRPLPSARSSRSPLLTEQWHTGARLSRSRRGAILLEVVVSLGLLVAAMAVIGYQISTSLNMAQATDLRTRTLLLVDSKMAELDAGVLNPSWAGDDLRGYFGIAYPGYSWRMRVKPAEITNLYLVALDIGFNERQVNQQVDNPDLEIHIDDPDTQILRTVYRLVPKPADVSVQRDFGVTQEELDAMIAAASMAGDANAGSGSDAGGLLGDVSGGGGGGGAGGIPNGAGGGGTGNMSQAEIMKALSKLIEAIVSGGLDPNSIDPRTLAQYLDAETLESLGPLIDMYFGNGPSSDMLPGPLDNPMIRNLLGGNRGNRGGGRGRGGRGGNQGQGPNTGADQGQGGDQGGNPNNDDRPGGGRRRNNRGDRQGNDTGSDNQNPNNQNPNNPNAGNGRNPRRNENNPDRDRGSDNRNPNNGNNNNSNNTGGRNNQDRSANDNRNNPRTNNSNRRNGNDRNSGNGSNSNSRNNEDRSDR